MGDNVELISKEITGRTQFTSVTVKVGEYELTTVITENYNGNSDSHESEIGTWEWNKEPKNKTTKRRIEIAAELFLRKEGI